MQEVSTPTPHCAEIGDCSVLLTAERDGPTERDCQLAEEFIDDAATRQQLLAAFISFTPPPLLPPHSIAARDHLFTRLLVASLTATPCLLDSPFACTVPRLHASRLHSPSSPAPLKPPSQRPQLPPIGQRTWVLMVPLRALASTECAGRL